MSELYLTRVSMSIPGVQRNPRPFKDLTGQTFGRLTVVRRVEGGNSTMFLCACSCGNTKIIASSSLSNGATTSCGCFFTEVMTTHGQTVGRKKAPEYRAWQDMWARCTKPSHPSYSFYKDRTPPDDWKDFTVFLAHVGPKPSPNHSLDRTDNTKPYGPGNVRWATKIEQDSNKSTNHYLTHNGKTQTMSQWARDLGMKLETLTGRINHRGWSVEKALSTPVGSVDRKRYITYAGKTQTINQWAVELGLNPGTLKTRLFKPGWSVEKALTTPTQDRPWHRPASV